MGFYMVVSSLWGKKIVFFCFFFNNTHMSKFIPIVITLVAAGFWLVSKRRLKLKLDKHNNNISPQLAMQVLGIQGKLTEVKVNDAYKKLMKKLHPDADGSDFLAKQVNEARNVLIKKINSQ